MERINKVKIKDTMEERFNKKFIVRNYEANAHTEDTHIIDLPEEILQFIHEEKKRYLKETIKEIIDLNTDKKFGTVDYKGLTEDLIKLGN